MGRTLDALADRPGWTVDGRAALYQPVGADWTGRVAELPGATRVTRSWHAAILRGGRAVWTVEVIDPIAAAEWVERQRPARTADRRQSG